MGPDNVLSLYILKLKIRDVSKGFIDVNISLWCLKYTLQEKLCSMLRDVLKNKPNVDVVKLQKSGGVVSRGAKFRQKARGYRIRVNSNHSSSFPFQ